MTASALKRLRVEVDMELVGKPKQSRFRQSKHLKLLDLSDGSALAAHPFLGRREVLAPALVQCLEFFQGKGLTSGEFEKKAGISAEAADRILNFFSKTGFITPLTPEAEDHQLEAEISKKITSQGTGVLGARSGGVFEKLVARDGVEQLRARTPGQSGNPDPIRFLLLGGCLAQLTQGYLEALGAQYGMEVTVDVGWTDGADLISKVDPQIIVFQPATDSFLEPLWDQAAFIGEDTRLERLENMKRFLGIQLGKILPQLSGRLLLVQGIAAPVESPFGRADFRVEIGMRQIVSELNSCLIDLIRSHSNAIFIDEDQVFSRAGKLRLLDDHVAPFSHHGPLDYYGAFGAISPDGPSRSESFGQTTELEAVQVLAREYLESYLLWSGKGRIKCVVVDLDNTLWPGVLGEGGAQMSESAFYRSYRFGTFGGIHQALKILKQRGVLLASCSKNDHDDAMSFWKKLSEKARARKIDNFLDPEDFAIHRINWKRKSENISEICSMLELDPGAVLFLDDNPVEREEVSFALPKVRTLGEDMNRVRLHLLSDPCLQSNVLTEESSRRTQLIKAQLSREAERNSFTDEKEFLKTLQIHISIRTASDDDVPRIAELIQRSNQFNTTQIRYDEETLRSFLKEGTQKVYCASVRDRFTDYGLVAVCVLSDQEVNSFVMSCRVIGLKVGLPILIGILRDQKYALEGLKARVRPTERNLPCQSLFRDAGFSEETDGVFELQKAEHLNPLDLEIYRVESEGSFSAHKNTAA